MNVLRNTFLTNRFFYAMGAIITSMMLAYGFPLILPVVKTAAVLFIVIVLIDVVVLFNKSISVYADRTVPPVMSLGDDNMIRLSITSRSGIRLWAEVTDELPEQFQVRNFYIRLTLLPGKPYHHVYHLKPLTRGEYTFGNIQLFLRSSLGLVKIRVTKSEPVSIPVYPSLIQLKKYELKTISRTATEYGVKKVRRIGHSYEFDHIKQYMRGDDYRSVNWKATGRRAQIMVNQYEDEKSQQVYCIIDKSRVMHMPFHGLSLFDYAVNASLVISNIVLGKQDKAGLITFADKVRSLVRADRNKSQLRKILETLYKEKEGSVEANYETLYMTIRKFVNGRSLLFLYTNFESTYALHRVLPQLRKLNDQHLLVVVLFENTEIRTDTSAHVETLEDIYTQITAEHYTLTRIQILQQLKHSGIISILTKPENLTVNSINKYLELKSRGMI